MDLQNVIDGGMGSFDFSVIIDKIYMLVGIGLLAAVIGGFVGGLLYLRKKKKKSKDMKKIGWWEETNGRLVPGRMDDAEEIVIPGTPLRVFYVAKRDLWLPRFTKGITPDLFYVAMMPNRQMVNFVLKSIERTLKEADVEFDHTDMLWASENTREFIKRNYRDKAVKWWQAYQGVITTAAYLVIITFSFILIIYMLRGVVQDISAVANTMNDAMKTSCQQAVGSGVVQG